MLEKREFEKPFPIQMQTIPALMCGRDVRESGDTVGKRLEHSWTLEDQERYGASALAGRCRLNVFPLSRGLNLRGVECSPVGGE